MEKEARRMGGTVYQHSNWWLLKRRRTAIGGSMLLKGPEVWSTWSKDTIGVEGFGDEVSETEMRRRPTAGSETTVEPFFSTVRASGEALLFPQVLPVST
jgi:hypothetical protein